MRFGMLRSRRLRDWGARLAAFALLLQLAISAGHMHPQDVFGSLGHPIAPGHGASWLQSGAGHAPTGTPADADGDQCAICAAMQLVATAVPPPPFLLSVPFDPIGPSRPAGDHLLPDATSFRLFQSRAPPFV
ncbi:MAG: DUF2946 family protein [Aliidongia sp.]